MIDEAPGSSDQPCLPRIQIREAGWRVGLKLGSEKTFCYQMAPGDDFYHRLRDGEIFVQHGDEKLCLPCAERRGLLSFTPRLLRDRPAELDVVAPDGSSEYDVRT